MKVELKGKKLFIEIDIEEKASKSGKTTVVATSGGNKPTAITYKDKTLMVGVNAYIPK